MAAIIDYQEKSKSRWHPPLGYLICLGLSALSLVLPGFFLCQLLLTHVSGWDLFALWIAALVSGALQLGVAFIPSMIYLGIFRPRRAPAIILLITALLPVMAMVVVLVLIRVQ